MTTAQPPAVALLSDHSLEMTGKDVPALEEAQSSIPADSLINVTSLGNEDLDMRVNAARAVRLGAVKLHFSTFGEMRATANWATEFEAKQNSAAS